MDTFGEQDTVQRYVGNLADAHSLSAKLTQDPYISDQPWWIIIGSMSAQERAEVIDHLASPGNVTVTKLTRKHRKLMAQRNPARTLSWRERLQRILIFPLSILLFKLIFINFASRLIGRGQRYYLIQIERVPPPNDP